VTDLWRNKPVRDNRDLERVKDASDIVRVIGEVVSLKPKGREFVCLCPFHNDHNPSMYVVPAKQFFNCFVCGAAGDVFAFVMRFHKMEFREALEYLAERAGIPLTPFRPHAGAAAPAGPSRQDLLTAASTAAEFFRGVLQHPEHGRAARGVIERRGIAPDMVSRFLIGAAPNRWDGLELLLKSRDLDPASFHDAGLLKRRDSDGAAYDAFRNRLIFPIQDQLGRVIAFGARRIDDADEPKYLNSPETRLFNKSATLYALNHAAKAIQAERTAVITEGYTDVIACHQAGFANTVATLGTALTREHVTVLRRLCDRVILLFDGDDAGQRAADRATELFFAEPLDVAICTLRRFTDAKDPDELLKRQGGADQFRAALAGSTDLLEYRFDRLRDRLAGSGLSALAKGIDEELARLAELGLKDVTPVRQRLIIRRLASLANVDEATILRAIPAGRSARPGTDARGADSPERGTDAARELPLIQTSTLTAHEHLLACVLCDPSLFASLDQGEQDFLSPRAYRWELLRSVAEIVRQLSDDAVAPHLNAVLAHTEDPSVQSAAVGLMSRIDLETDRNADRLRAHWSACLARARHDRITTEVKTTPTGDDLAETLAAIEQRRRSISAHGADRRRLPRPNGG